MKRYRPSKIESKWQKKWEDAELYNNREDDLENTLYCLDMFPYPSGDGLHVGHVRIYTASDVLARYFRSRGYSVLHPMGWDAFGLPAENDALRHQKNPNERVPRNIERFRQQMKMLGFSYDWEREFATCDPAYYKWTQWLFLKFYEKGLAYQDVIPINWCPSCKTGLADEEVVGGKCDRCGTEVTKRDMKQWLLRITDYADRLLDDLDKDELDWPEGIVKMQKDWIGRSTGLQIQFPLFDFGLSIPVFTTRPDTIFGVTFFALAPEHPVLENIKSQIPKAGWEQIEDYIERAKKKSELERKAEIEEKTGVFTGCYILNPLSGEKVPVYVSDFVLMSYGTGAVMGVPAHDQRDWEFAKKFELPIRRVISGGDISEKAYVGGGELLNSGDYEGLSSEEALSRIGDDLEAKGLGKRTVSYHIRDWVFSRQRYWGEPFPLIHCDHCGVVPVPEEDLPVKLPYLENYEPTGTGKSPLSQVDDWVNVNCPRCGGPAKRETDTMPNWAGSCWYFLRFADPHNEKQPFSQEELKRWLPVDWYLGGAEHAVMHLLYARFWVKVFCDLGLVAFDEPFLHLRGVGMVLSEDGRKMSKSWHNVVNPDDVVKAFGADSLRVYEMFMGPWDQALSWNTHGVVGCHRFLEKVWRLVKSATSNISESRHGALDLKSDPMLEKQLHRLIKKVGEDIEAVKFNTAIAAMMEFLNEVQARIRADKVSPSAKNADLNRSSAGLSADDCRKFLLILAPFAPHITEELWQKLNNTETAHFSADSSIHTQSWPGYDSNLIKEAKATIVVQIDGKVRETFETEKGLSEKEARKTAEAFPGVKEHLSGRSVSRVIWVPDQVLNFVTKS